MKVHLMYRDREFDAAQKGPPNEATLTQDLELDTLLDAMAQGDKLIRQVARTAILSGLQDDLETVLYRQAVLQDCLRHEEVAKALAHLAVEAAENKRKQWLGMFNHSPGGVLHGAVGLMEMLLGILRKLRDIAAEHGHGFESAGFKTLFAMIETELPDEYFGRIRAHLEDLRFRHGVLVGAELGPGNVGTDYRLRKSPGPEPNWFQRLLARWSKDYRDFTFRIADRDESGARILSELRDRGINSAANALAQSVDHITSFLAALQTELTFYLRRSEPAPKARRQRLPGLFSGARGSRCVDARVRWPAGCLSRSAADARGRGQRSGRQRKKSGGCDRSEPGRQIHFPAQHRPRATHDAVRPVRDRRFLPRQCLPRDLHAL